MDTYYLIWSVYKVFPLINVPWDWHSIPFVGAFLNKIENFSLNKKMRCCLWYNNSWNTSIDIDTSLTIQLNYLLCVGNLSLNQSCMADKQCSTSNYSRCVDEKCSCMEGYSAENLTSCIKCKVFILYY